VIKKEKEISIMKREKMRKTAIQNGGRDIGHGDGDWGI
jgi:hypothetical protein